MRGGADGGVVTAADISLLVLRCIGRPTHGGAVEARAVEARAVEAKGGITLSSLRTA